MRSNAFDKEWLYLNLQSEIGCAVTVTVHFKSETAQPKPSLAKHSIGDGGDLAEKSVQSPKNAVKAGEGLSEEINFATWNLGNGKMKEKRAKLEGLLYKLMDKNNRKLKQQHEKHC